MQAAQPNATLSPVDVTLTHHRRHLEVLRPLGYLLRVKGRWLALPSHPLPQQGWRGPLVLRYAPFRTLDGGESWAWL